MAEEPTAQHRLLALGRELRRVHQRLREAVEVAREAVEDESGPATGLDPLVYCWGFCQALAGHHEGEDAGLFPLLLRTRPDLGPVVDRLVQDHAMIATLLGDLQRALGDGQPPAVLRGHLDGLTAVLESHLGYEERQLLPALDELAPVRADRRAVLGPLA